MQRPNKTSPSTGLRPKGVVTIWLASFRCLFLVVIRKERFITKAVAYLELRECWHFTDDVLKGGIVSELRASKFQRTQCLPG